MLMSNDNKTSKPEPRSGRAVISYQQVTSSSGFNEKTMEPEWVSELKAKSRLRGHTSPKSERLR